ncbi:ABC transporter permease [Olsenella sp. TM06-36]|uniref:ABC transporter permease n=1 Tax=unclassified Olsenella TaxID=2638792 RepID=UPI000E436926|nr:MULTISPECIES: ABC transporter permease [unclassified Olsenella]RGJ46770.1 ABC transporter permease [Olsenella sp. TM06-36]RHJ92821.1 ABC transporter permease [Olsenella sp. AM05-7]RHJ97853.1 ABC transporter permease [Olsenella sp. AM05-17]
MSFLEQLLSMNMVLATLRMAIPLTLGSIGGVLCERSGIVNLGIEGMMLAGSFAGAVGAYYSQSALVGVLTAILVGGLVGLLHAVLCIHFHTKQSVSGVGINILVSGLTIVLCRAIFDSDGMSAQVSQVPNVTVPGLSAIPVVGEIFSNQSPYLFAMLIVTAATWWFMYRTTPGLRLRVIGDNPQAAETAGINVTKYRYIAVIACGMLCGLAGSYLSISQGNVFVKDMVAGRGFMALAAMIFGGWNPLGSMLASLLFAFAQAIRISMQVDVPDQLLQMLPYAITLLALMFVGRKIRGPQASGDIPEEA